jgi:hypothetical protein
MPRHGSVKVKKMMPKGSAEDANMLNDMFSQMTGSENADPDIIIPKLCNLNNLLIKYSKVYKLLLTFKDFTDNFPECESNFTEISNFIVNLEHIVTDSSKFTEEILKTRASDDINALYKKFKTVKEVQDIIITSSNLGKYKRYLTDINNLGDEFIKREPGLSFKPIAFTGLDLKVLWASDKLSNMAKKYILSIISHTYNTGHKIYQLVTSPDIDIKKFSEVLIKNIEKMKKQIPRCNKAFDIIANSVNLLENNFGGYYKTSVEAENPSIIIESFIIDVSMSQKANATVTTQFRKIIMFMKRQSANSKDPRVSKLFKILNSQFNMMEKETGVNPDSDDESTKKESNPNNDPTNTDPTNTDPTNTDPTNTEPNDDEPNDEPNDDEPNDEPNDDEPNDEPNDDEPNDEPNDDEHDDETENITSVIQDLMSSITNEKQ